jgi:hypothetical protein
MVAEKLETMFDIKRKRIQGVQRYKGLEVQA